MQSYLWIREFLVGGKKEKFERLLKAEAEREYVSVCLDHGMCPECSEKSIEKEHVWGEALIFTCSKCGFKEVY